MFIAAFIALFGVPGLLLSPLIGTFETFNIFYILLFGLVGMAYGYHRGRPSHGFKLGAFGGLVGLVGIAASEPTAERTNTLRERENARRKRNPHSMF